MGAMSARWLPLLEMALLALGLYLTWRGGGFG
jgi:hypothetical protein